jgi:hypothetical protein
MRMQLSARCAVLALLAACVLVTPAHADGGVALGGTLFHERGGPLKMTVVVPSASANVDVAQPLNLHVGWSADIVTGASVAVVDAPAAKVDAITTATVVDTRHAFNGGLTLKDGIGSVDVTYGHAFEHDYRSDSFAVTARTDLNDRDTGLEISYARAFDRVCDLAGTFEPVLKPRLDTSRGCFSGDKTRATRPLAIHTFQAGVSQALTPQLTAQLRALAEVLHGFQSNPYRAIRIGKTAAQEYEPLDRARYALSAGVRYWLLPLSAALGGEARVYRDTWGIGSLAGEVSYDQTVLSSLRLRLRGRYYTQTSASFYSDDYILDPKGRYFTGDRELSSMQSLLISLSVRWSAPPSDSGEVLGFLSSLTLVLQGDLLKTYFDDFHYDRAEVPNTLAQVLTLELRAGF